jgi:hypothetical protein
MEDLQSKTAKLYERIECETRQLGKTEVQAFAIERNESSQVATWDNQSNAQPVRTLDAWREAYFTERK